MPSTLRTALLVFMAAVGAHLLAFGAGWIWDDNDYITANSVVQSVNGWLTCWTPGTTPQYYPLVFLSFWVEHGIAGLDPTLYHANNVLLHAGSSVLLWCILRALAVRHAVWIAVIFAVHPMGVESVAWATERKNTLSMFLSLASILCFIAAGRAGAKRVLGFHVAAFALFVCALLSKTTAIFVAPTLVLVALHERRKIDTRFVFTVLPYFVVGAALGLFTAYVEKAQVGARGNEFSLGLIERFLLAARNIVFYITHFTVPTEQMFVYPRDEIRIGSIGPWRALAVMVVLLVICIRAWRHERGPLLVLLWLCAALFPALGFFDVWPFRFSYVADHFAYAAMPALATGLVLLIARAARHRERIASVAIIAFVAACFPLSWIATAKYANAEALWRDTIARNPAAWLAQNNLATELLEQAGQAMREGQDERMKELAAEALEHATLAFEQKPDEMTHASNRSEALRLLGRNDEALAAIDVAIAVAPHLAELRWMRGRLLESLARNDDARSAYLSVANDQGDRTHEIGARLALMRMSTAAKDFADAAIHARRIVELSPGSGDAAANYASILAAGGDADGARAAFARALRDGNGFSSERVYLTTAARFLRAVATENANAAEMSVAREVLLRLAPAARGDPMLRALALAIAARAGEPTARGELEKLAADARRAQATQVADEIDALLKSIPASR